MDASFENQMCRGLKDFDRVWARVSNARAGDGPAAARTAGVPLMPKKCRCRPKPCRRF